MIGAVSFIRRPSLAKLLLHFSPDQLLFLLLRSVHYRQTTFTLAGGLDISYFRVSRDD